MTDEPVLLPTTMVGAYPRPAWFREQLEGRDIREAFKVIYHDEAFKDAVQATIHDQELAGLDIVTDGQMWFDDYAGGIGSFFWYWFERINGLSPAKLDHPALARAPEIDEFTLEAVGGVAVEGEISRGPLRLAELYRIAAKSTTAPLKFSVGAGPMQLSTMAHFVSGPVTNRFELTEALLPVFRAEIEDLVAAGCRHIQLEDLGAWIPNVTKKPKDVEWVTSGVDALFADLTTDDGVPVERSWHFCLGNSWGSRAEGLTAGGYEGVLPDYLDTEVDAFVLDFACRDMFDIGVLSKLPASKSVHAGVVDVRNMEVEHPDQIADRIRKLLGVIDADRVTLTTDCGMKQLPRPVAAAKLGSLVKAARIVRHELTGVRGEVPEKVQT